MHTKWAVKPGVFLILSQKEQGLMPTDLAGLCQDLAVSLIHVLP